jgi:hypothetical protein
VLLVASAAGAAYAQPQGRGGSPPATPRAAAPIDLTGYWVAFVSEEWRYRMMTPPKGDYRGVPLNPEGRRIADTWNPATEESAEARCKPYGAAAIMRVPGRLHVTWQDDNTLRLDADAGTQTRVFRFSPAAAAGPRTLQGQSAARWDVANRSLTVVTTNMLPGYLRRNGVPYSENATVTEHFDVAPAPENGQLLVVTTIVDDPAYLQRRFIISSHFKKERDGSKWSPAPCARW